MSETESYLSRALSPFREESCVEELSVLPRHTKVIVKGNNRTKSVLVGLQGVVKKAVGLSGWHWLVLKNGIEVKLQRNALIVLEPPTGNEEDNDSDVDDRTSGSDAAEKDRRGFASSLHLSKKSKPKARNSRPWFSSSGSRKSVNRGGSKEVQSGYQTSRTRVNLAKLGSGSLWRYWRAFDLESVCPSPSKDQLVSTVQQHFSSQKVDEVGVIVEFIGAARKRRPGNRP